MLRAVLLAGLLATAASEGGGGTESDPVPPNFDGTWSAQSFPGRGSAAGSTATLTATPSTGNTYQVTARITSTTQLQVTIAGQTATFSK